MPEEEAQGEKRSVRRNSSTQNLEELAMRQATARELRRAREQASYSREQVRRALGHGYKTVILGWENGHAVPDIKSAIRLAKLYGCSLADLLPSFIAYWAGTVEPPKIHPEDRTGYRRPPAHRKRKWERDEDD